MSARRRPVVAVVAGLVLVLALAGCTRHKTVVITTETVIATTTQTLTSSPPAQASYVPPPATIPAPLPPGAKPAAGETEQACPYIANDDVADIEGDHVYRSTVLTTMTPVGCRFYFYASPYNAIADIEPTTFANSTLAYNAMVATGLAGKGTLSAKNIIPGVDGVTYQTTFSSPDGGKDFACTFAKGNVMVTVHTQQNNISFNAKALAAAIAPKF
jgi:hypothetical protein